MGDVQVAYYIKMFSGCKESHLARYWFKGFNVWRKKLCHAIARYQQLAELENLRVEKSRRVPGHVV